MDLTTPKLTDFDSVFPGENFFFYWKTSASLWKKKMMESSNGDQIFVPIFWGFHLLDGQADDKHQLFDFAEKRPETDLKRLVNIAEELGKEILFLLPLTPVPYLPNGGMPPNLASTVALTEKGLAQAFLDQENKIHKIYSFYDPRVFQGYQKFTYALGRYFSSSGIDADVLGMIGGHTVDGVFQSYWQDLSHCFDQGFSRFLSLKKEENGDIDLVNVENENDYREEYLGIISDLYLNSAKDSLAANWRGVLKVSFLGGAPEDIFYRSSDKFEHASLYFPSLLNILTMDALPSTCLLAPEIKKGILQRCLVDLLNRAFIEEKLNHEIDHDEELSFHYRPLKFFDIFEKNSLPSEKKDLYGWQDIGLLQFLYRDFRWTHSLREEFEISFDTNLTDRNFFFLGRDVDAEVLRNIFKIFMNGGKVFLTTSQLNPDLKKKIDVFLIENSLDIQKFQFMVPVTTTQLGGGMLIILEEEPLLSTPMDKRNDFWGRFIDLLEVNHLPIEEEEGIQYYWRTRIPGPAEMSYEEIRRLSLFNPTSYKKKTHINSRKNFAFLKIIDETNAKINSGSMGIEIEILPGGSVSLDFGYFE